jgi:hypothetical protein
MCRPQKLDCVSVLGSLPIDNILNYMCLMGYQLLTARGRVQFQTTQQLRGARGALSRRTGRPCTERIVPYHVRQNGGKIFRVQLLESNPRTLVCRAAAVRAVWTVREVDAWFVLQRRKRAIQFIYFSSFLKRGLIGVPAKVLLSQNRRQKEDRIGENQPFENEPYLFSMRFC